MVVLFSTLLVAVVACVLAMIDVHIQYKKDKILSKPKMAAVLLACLMAVGAAMATYAASEESSTQQENRHLRVVTQFDAISLQFWAELPSSEPSVHRYAESLDAAFTEFYAKLAPHAGDPEVVEKIFFSEDLVFKWVDRSDPQWDSFKRFGIPENSKYYPKPRTDVARAFGVNELRMFVFKKPIDANKFDPCSIQDYDPDLDVTLRSRAKATFEREISRQSIRLSGDGFQADRNTWRTTQAVTSTVDLLGGQVFIAFNDCTPDTARIRQDMKFDLMSFRFGGRVADIPNDWVRSHKTAAGIPYWEISFPKSADELFKSRTFVRPIKIERGGRRVFGTVRETATQRASDE